MISLKLKSILLFIGNTAIAIAWLRVIFTFMTQSITEENTCQSVRRQTLFALSISAIELLNSVLGLTKSKPHQVLLFSATRAGVELFLAPLMPCNALEHLWTVGCWALDGPFRFGCFAVDSFLTVFGFKEVPMVKSIRYTVSPMIFPLGAGGEMFMVLRAARDGRPALYLAATLWPLFFYPLMKQLLNQRKKHFNRLKTIGTQRKDV